MTIKAQTEYRANVDDLTMAIYGLPPRLSSAFLFLTGISSTIDCTT